MLKTRSGLALQRGHQNLRPMPEGRSRAEKSPKPKKIKKEKIKAEKKVAKLDKPLSILTKEFKHVEVHDIEAYVNRSAEQRRKEVDEGKVPGKVKRPMNSFMLYRKAYQNRAKEWCLQNNHQVVSQVCGDSWPQEPDEIKDQFSEWARIERLNHQNAHPGYKFSPTKPGTAKAKRKQSEDLSDESELNGKADPAEDQRSHANLPGLTSLLHIQPRDQLTNTIRERTRWSQTIAATIGRPTKSQTRDDLCHHSTARQACVRANITNRQSKTTLPWLVSKM
jgi:isopentenyldiphosphate isomerase